MDAGGSETADDLQRSEDPQPDQLGADLIAEGGTQIVWEDRWQEEQIFANRLSFFILAQSFLVVAAVTATLSNEPTSRWLPVTLVIDVAALALTAVFWYGLTENLRRLDTLKAMVAEGSREAGVRGYREIGVVRAAHHELRSQRGLHFPLSLLPRWSPTWWLANGVPVLFGSTWIALIIIAILTSA